MPELRGGVRLPRRKAEIFDKIKRMPGIRGEDMGNPNAIKSHVWQINELLEDTGYRIKGTRGRGGGYYLVRTQRLTEAHAGDM